MIFHNSSRIMWAVTIFLTIQTIVIFPIIQTVTKPYRLELLFHSISLRTML